MKRKITLIFVAVISSLLLYSCMKDSDPTYYADSIVTIRPTTPGGIFSMKLNDTINLIPTNIGASPYDHEVRAYISFSTNYPQLTKGNNEVYLYGLDTLLTKSISENLGEANVSTYGDDVMEVRDSWETCIEDGYLTIRFGALWSANAVEHNISLVQDAEDPLKFTLYHNANGDKGWYEIDSIIAFRMPKIEAALAEGKDYTEITLYWKETGGMKSISLKYKE